MKKYGYKILIVIPFIFLAFAYIAVIAPSIKVDKCLDSGGRWNYDLKICEMS